MIMVLMVVPHSSAEGCLVLGRHNAPKAVLVQLPRPLYRKLVKVFFLKRERGYAGLKDNVK